MKTLAPPLVGLGLLLTLAGCSIRQNVQPVTLSADTPREICVIENLAVRTEVLDAYKNALASKHFIVKLVPQGSGRDACPLTTAYTANWAWDLALYLVYADIRVFQDGHLVGEALYDSRSGGGNLGKFISAEAKIQELTNQLFPG